MKIHSSFRLISYWTRLCGMKTVTTIDPLTTQTLADEILGIGLYDKRLNRCASKVIEPSGRQPRSSITSAIRGWSETRSALDLIRCCCCLLSFNTR